MDSSTGAPQATGDTPETNNLSQIRNPEVKTQLPGSSSSSTVQTENSSPLVDEFQLSMGLEKIRLQQQLEELKTCDEARLNELAQDEEYLKFMASEEGKDMLLNITEGDVRRVAGGQEVPEELLLILRSYKTNIPKSPVREENLPDGDYVTYELNSFPHPESNPSTGYANGGQTSPPEAESAPVDPTVLQSYSVVCLEASNTGEMNLIPSPVEPESMAPEQLSYEEDLSSQIIAVFRPLPNDSTTYEGVPVTIATGSDGQISNMHLPLPSQIEFAEVTQHESPERSESSPEKMFVAVPKSVLYKRQSMLPHALLEGDSSQSPSDEDSPVKMQPSNDSSKNMAKTFSDRSPSKPEKSTDAIRKYVRSEGCSGSGLDSTLATDVNDRFNTSNSSTSSCVVIGEVIHCSQGEVAGMEVPLSQELSQESNESVICDSQVFFIDLVSSSDSELDRTIGTEEVESLPEEAQLPEAESIPTEAQNLQQDNPLVRHYEEQTFREIDKEVDTSGSHKSDTTLQIQEINMCEVLQNQTSDSLKSTPQSEEEENEGEAEMDTLSSESRLHNSTFNCEVSEKEESSINEKSPDKKGFKHAGKPVADSLSPPNRRSTRLTVTTLYEPESDQIVFKTPEEIETEEKSKEHQDLKGEEVRKRLASHHLFESVENEAHLVSVAANNAHRALDIVADDILEQSLSKDNELADNEVEVQEKGFHISVKAKAEDQTEVKSLTKDDPSNTSRMTRQTTPKPKDNTEVKVNETEEEVELKTKTQFSTPIRRTRKRESRIKNLMEEAHLLFGDFDASPDTEGEEKRVTRARAKTVTPGGTNSTTIECSTPESDHETAGTPIRPHRRRTPVSSTPPNPEDATTAPEIPIVEDPIPTSDTKPVDEEGKNQTHKNDELVHLMDQFLVNDDARIFYFGPDKIPKDETAVKVPIDLNLIKEQIESGDISTIETLERNITLMFLNYEMCYSHRTTKETAARAGLFINYCLNSIDEYKRKHSSPIDKPQLSRFVTPVIPQSQKKGGKKLDSPSNSVESASSHTKQDILEVNDDDYDIDLTETTETNYKKRRNVLSDSEGIQKTDKSLVKKLRGRPSIPKDQPRDRIPTRHSTN